MFPWSLYLSWAQALNVHSGLKARSTETCETFPDSAESDANCRVPWGSAPAKHDGLATPQCSVPPSQPEMARSPPLLGSSSGNPIILLGFKLT